MVFEGYSYRTDSRFGGRVRISVEESLVTVTGPRVSQLVYHLWYAVQFLLLWSAPVVAIGAAVLLGNGWYLLLFPGMVAIEALFGGLGVAAFWEWVSLANVHAGRDQSASFPVTAVKRVKIGKGWARHGVPYIIPFAIPGIDQLSMDRAVSFEALDSESGRECAYAILLWDEQDAQDLAKLLS